ncbi:hypothetical protein [Methylomonas fluvii]|uniref:Restriction endonuclease n=1 Tax=Methylomonas fluvii TaxID=1854564 RepID=A0ABR9DKI4_9GAMM|nr:hypothetical protein [Methylomonas fluvii]MBD9363618.1 hypothetical protein [Methylomonas fluvii]
MSRIHQYLEQKYPGSRERAIFRTEIIRLCEEFIQSGYADDKFENELTSHHTSKFWSCLSEALIFEQLRGKHFLSRRNIGVGPDFLIECNGRKLWIEVICPTPSGIPDDWLEIQLNRAPTAPNTEILLRWASAYKEKAERLLGNPSGKPISYLANGIVSEQDLYVIAINGCQLRHGPFSALHGMSQFPYAAEAVFPIGPYQVHFDRATMNIVDQGYQERLNIPKPKGKAVPADAFLNPTHNMISALWAVDFNGCRILGNHQPSAIIHNPCAQNPLPYGFLPSDDEFHAVATSEEFYSFCRL